MLAGARRCSTTASIRFTTHEAMAVSVRTLAAATPVRLVIGACAAAGAAALTFESTRRRDCILMCRCMCRRSCRRTPQKRWKGARSAAEGARHASYACVCVGRMTIVSTRVENAASSHTMNRGSSTRASTARPRCVAVVYAPAAPLPTRTITHVCAGGFRWVSRAGALRRPGAVVAQRHTWSC